MINLFPEIKDQIEGVLHSDVLQKNADIELQQRALEYFKVFNIILTGFCEAGFINTWNFSQVFASALFSKFYFLNPQKTTILKPKTYTQNFKP